MSDPCLTYLLSRLSDDARPTLWLADEAQGEVLPQLVPFAGQLTLLSNRYDIARQARALGLNCHFSDWQIPEGHGYGRVLFRLMKEKAVIRHLLGQVRGHLLPTGCVTLVGEKQEGIRSAHRIAAERLGDAPRLQKSGGVYWADFYPRGDAVADDEDDYNTLRIIGEWQGRSLFSKPGVYGWNKIDQGSALLAEQIRLRAPALSSPLRGLLDLGCGYGFLTLTTLDIPCVRRVATDTNAGALACTAYNLAQQAAQVTAQQSAHAEVIAADCADEVTGLFDWVVCNPPFHSGFDVNSDLTLRFLRAAHDRLHSDGQAWFVVNRFIPLERKASDLFPVIETLADDGQFKVVLLKKSR